jgi:acyl-CoA synthetase (NDP forming)
MIKPATLESIFNPTSVAVAGAAPGKAGQLFLDSVLASGFRGNVYAINPKGAEVSGVRAYTSIEDVPGPIDYLVCCIPGIAVPQLIKDCAAKGVKVVSIFTAGFSESGSEAGRQLEMEISRLAQATGVRVLGPNCLGVYCPKAELSFASDFPGEPGRVALIGQSGGNTSYLIRAAAHRGVRFSKAISYGNACNVDESELLEYLLEDTETEVVAAYIEGVKDGPRFYRAIRDMSKVKPVLVLKGGYTEVGGEVAASHTGALAGSGSLWGSLLEQAGAVQVYSLEEMVDVLVTFALMAPPKGRRAGVFGGGGGASVLATDELTGAGFAIPALPPDLRDELAGLFGTTAGMILRNPIDLSMVGYGQGFYNIVKRLLTFGEGDWLDFALIHAGFGQAAWFSASAFEKEIELFRDFITRIYGEVDKPLALVLQFLITSWDWQKALDLQRGCSDAGMPVYHSMVGAARAIDHFLRYHERRRADS